jgi:hypothetical protein
MPSVCLEGRKSRHNIGLPNPTCRCRVGYSETQGLELKYPSKPEPLFPILFRNQHANDVSRHQCFYYERHLRRWMCEKVTRRFLASNTWSGHPAFRGSDIRKMNFL